LIKLGVFMMSLEHLLWAVAGNPSEYVLQLVANVMLGLFLVNEIQIILAQL
jgi:hypothetical protein